MELLIKFHLNDHNLGFLLRFENVGAILSGVKNTSMKAKESTAQQLSSE